MGDKECAAATKTVFRSYIGKKGFEQTLRRNVRQRRRGTVFCRARAWPNLGFDFLVHFERLIRLRLRRRVSSLNLTLAGSGAASRSPKVRFRVLCCRCRRHRSSQPTAILPYSAYVDGRLVEINLEIIWAAAGALTFPNKRSTLDTAVQVLLEYERDSFGYGHGR